MNENDKKKWTLFRESTSNVISKEEFEIVCEFHAKYFEHEYQKPCTCNTKKIQRWIDELNQLYFGNRPSI